MMRSEWIYVQREWRLVKIHFHPFGKVLGIRSFAWRLKTSNYAEFHIRNVNLSPSWKYDISTSFFFWHTLKLFILREKTNSEADCFTDFLSLFTYTISFIFWTILFISIGIEVLYLQIAFQQKSQIYVTRMLRKVEKVEMPGERALTNFFFMRHLEYSAGFHPPHVPSPCTKDAGRCSKVKILTAFILWGRGQKGDGL